MWVFCLSSKSTVIYQQLKNDLVSLRFDLNEVITEQTIANRFNVSKTPVREALATLVQEGYLIKSPNRGYFVKELRINEYYEVVQLRFILESGIVRLIITNSTDEEISSLYDVLTEKEIEYCEYFSVNLKFHLAMAALTKNSYIRDALERVFDLNRRELSMDYFKTARYDIHKDHRVIVDTLLKRDTEKAVELIRQELKRSDDSGVWFY